MKALAHPDGARTVTGLERVWLAADAVQAPFAIGWCVHGTGTPQVAAWSAAMVAVVARWPLVAARQAGWGRGLRWVAGGAAPPVLAVSAGAAAAPPLDARWGPVAALTVAPGPEGWTLTFWGHHAVFDARGLARFAEAVAAAARGEALPAGGAAPALAQLGSPGPALGRAALRAAQREPPPDQRPVLAGAGTGADTLAGTTWGWRRVAAQPRQVTARAALALARLAAADHGAEAVRLGLPVDLRPRWPAPVAPPHNLTGIGHLAVRATDPVAAVTTAVQALAVGPAPWAHAAAAERVCGLPLWLLRWAARSAVRQRRAAGRFGAAAVVSNVGRHAPEALSGAGFAARFAVWSPPQSPAVPLFVMLGGDASGVSVSAAMPRALAEGGRLDRVLDALTEALS